MSTATFHGCADEIEALSDSPDCANGEISVKDIFFKKQYILDASI